MKKTSFEFREQISSAFGRIKRPVADVMLKTSNGELFVVRMLIDSGADVSVISPQIAKILGVKIRQGERKIFRGIGGKVTMYLHKIWIKIGEFEVIMPVAIPLKRRISNILGRREALDFCNVCFLKGQQTLFEYE